MVGQGEGRPSSRRLIQKNRLARCSFLFRFLILILFARLRRLPSPSTNLYSRLDTIPWLHHEFRQQ